MSTLDNHKSVSQIFSTFPKKRKALEWAKQQTNLTSEQQNVIADIYWLVEILQWKEKLTGEGEFDEL